MLGKYYELRNPIMERQNLKNQQLHVQKVNEIFSSSSKYLSLQEKDEEQRIQKYFNRKAYHNKFTNQEKYFYQSQEDRSLLNRIGEIKTSKKQKSNSSNFPLSLNETLRKLNDQRIKTENQKILMRIEQLTSSKDKNKIKKEMKEYFKMKNHISQKRKNNLQLPPIEPRTIRLSDRKQNDDFNSKIYSSSNKLLLNSSLNTSKEDQSKINEQEISKKLKDMENQQQQKENKKSKKQEQEIKKEPAEINQTQQQQEIKKEPQEINETEQQQQEIKKEPKQLDEEQKEGNNQEQEAKPEENNQQQETKPIADQGNNQEEEVKPEENNQQQETKPIADQGNNQEQEVKPVEEEQLQQDQTQTKQEEEK